MQTILHAWELIKIASDPALVRSNSATSTSVTSVNITNNLNNLNKTSAGGTAGIGSKNILNKKSSVNPVTIRPGLNNLNKITNTTTHGIGSESLDLNITSSNNTTPCSRENNGMGERERGDQLIDESSVASVASAGNTLGLHAVRNTGAESSHGHSHDLSNDNLN